MVRMKRRSETPCDDDPAPPIQILVRSIVQFSPTTESEVQEHNQAVMRRGADRTCYTKRCGRCQSESPFSPHDLRRRSLRLIENCVVLCMSVWLARWRCRNCRYVFTDYPDFRTPV